MGNSSGKRDKKLQVIYLLVYELIALFPPQLVCISSGWPQVVAPWLREKEMLGGAAQGVPLSVAWKKDIGLPRATTPIIDGEFSFERLLANIHRPKLEHLDCLGLSVLGKL